MPAQKTATCLWFDTEGEEAARFYCSLIEGSEIHAVNRFPVGVQPSGGPPMPEGAVMLVRFSLAGTDYWALNGGPQFKHTEACSIVVHCRDQAEIDRLWEALSADGGAPIECGWLRDRWGVFWQIVPERLEQLMDQSDPAAAARVMAALWGMKKLDVAALEAARRG